MAKSITFWNRLEPRPRGRSIRRSLAAEIRDPLWLLTRQWQLGELQGEDAASLRGVVVDAETVPLKSWQGRVGPKTDLVDAPLESQMLAEPYAPDLTMKVELAEKFLELVGDAQAPGMLELLRQAYPFPALIDDPLQPIEKPAQRFHRFMSSRLFDGFALYRAAADGATIPGGAPAQAAAESLKEWVDSTYSALLSKEQALEHDPRTWYRERLEHRGTLEARDNAGGVVTLAACPAAGGELDWDSFELAGQIAPGTPLPTQPVELQPAHVRFPGMPNARFWDFEESTLSFADVEPDTRDLAKLILVEFALIHGADWFYFDLPQPVGSLCRIRSLVVKDVFGGQTVVERARTSQGPRSAFFRLSRAAGAPAGTPDLADFLLVPPTSAILQQSGAPLEEVLFARDEMANLAWAVERATPGLLGEPWPGQERDAALPVPPEPTSGDAAPPLRYQIMSRVPVHWTPFLPARVNAVRGSNRPQVVLLSSTVLRDPPIPKPIRGKILRPDNLADELSYVLHEEEVPRSGVQVRRVMVRSRWTNGSSHLWFARVRAAGSGETGSGLRFDRALETRR